MGCDIHAHIEVQINSKWHHYLTPNIRRNYALFTRMANVRGIDNNAIAPDRGIPDDVSEVTKLSLGRNEEDFHSASWMSSDEFAAMFKYHQTLVPSAYLLDYEQYGYLFGNTLDGFRSNPDNYPKEIQDFRMVFWFDN